MDLLKRRIVVFSQFKSLQRFIMMLLLHYLYRFKKRSSINNNLTSPLCKLLNFNNCLQNFVIYLVFINLFMCKYSVVCATLQQTNNHIYGDSCDWSGSGLDAEFENGRPGITQLYLRCTAGHVTWTYPRGALRILLRLPSHQPNNGGNSNSNNNNEFKACIKLHAEKNTVRVFLEGQRSLHPLELDGTSTKQIRCFQSRKGQAALYVESVDWKDLKKQTVQLEYDLQMLPEGVTIYDPFEECRPCSNDELVHAFCTSDLVTRGTIQTVENFNDLETSELNVRVTKLIRHIALDDDEYNTVMSDNGLRGHHRHSGGVADDINEIVTHTSGRTARSISIQVGAHCGVTHGAGEFVFMARRRLGALIMKCAPRLEEWMDTVRMMKEQGRDQCVLNS